MTKGQASLQSSNEAIGRSCITSTRTSSTTSACGLRLIVFLLLCLDRVFAVTYIPAAGCADGTREGLYDFYAAAACKGSWDGHVSNASHLCAPGWRVCTPLDLNILRNISWADAHSVRGCMAFNAAQDGGRCRDCQEHLERDDMAGIGHDCAHQYVDQPSCISGGRIDASCCVDSHFHKACHYKPGYISGVVCCRLPVRPPNIVVKPPRTMRVYKDLIFLLSCQATGMPPPRVMWYKNGRRIKDGDSRITILSSGDLLVTLTRRVDTGLYTCEAINEQGVDMASSYVKVAEKINGCADGSAEGLHKHNNVQACAGVWKGHVKSAKSLCARGWKVCNHRSRRYLRQISTFELFELPGCYAYNAANRRSSCRSRCSKGPMAGIGNTCGWRSLTHTSCLSQGRIDVHASNSTSSCDFAPGITTGVLCCKKHARSNGHKKCSPKCKNDGICIGLNRCKCSQGYKGSRCQIPICEPGCGPKGRCVRPGKCRCKTDYSGKSCRRKKRRCTPACVNGGRCRNGRCVCPATFWGKTCQYPLQHVLVSRLSKADETG